MKHIEDPKQLVSDLQELWAKPNRPLDFVGHVMFPLSETEYDQETVGDNPYWEIARWLPAKQSARKVDPYATVFASIGGYRDPLVSTFAWSIPSPSDIAWLTSLLDGRGVVEIGAGTGYWAWQLSQALVDVTAFDKQPGENKYCGPTQYHPVHRGGPEKAAEYPTRALLLCWPPMSSMATEALAAYTGDTLIYIGEPEGGCTADDDFFVQLDSDWVEVGVAPEHVTFWGIHCYVTGYRRKVAG